MTLDELLKPDHVICDDANIMSKKQVLDCIVKCACEHDEKLNYVEVLQALIRRERLGSTAIGHGIAIPHARIPDIDQPIVCLLTLHNALSFYEEETVAVDIIFGILAPIEATDAQLAILSDITKRLQHKSYRDNLRNAKTNEALYQAALAQPQDTEDDQKDTDNLE